MALSPHAVVHRMRPNHHGLRRALEASIDACAMFVALLAGVFLRYDFSVGSRQLREATLFGLLAIVVLVVVGLWSGLYLGRHRVGSFEELRTVVGVVIAVTVVLVAIDALHRFVPLSVPLIAGPIALTFAASYRYAWRWLRERAMRPSGDGTRPLVVIGGGEAGEQIITAMLRNANGRHTPIAVLDDDPHKSGLRIRGVPVRGSSRDLVRVATEFGATDALLAIPSINSAGVREIEREAREAGIRLLVLPSVGELYGARVGVGDIRPVTTADLLGRNEVDTDVESIAGYLTGRRVLVTGAGGSIGSELCRQIHRFAPASLVMLERDESALHAVQLSIEGRALLDSRDLVVADIRDEARIRSVFQEHRPEVVFHAAALKHLPLLESHPSEALKTNVWGTETLLRAAASVGVERFVNVSTDKAADPTSVLGYTKRLAERLTAATAGRTPGVFMSVRFGNVLGSRGSVLTAFREQIGNGGPVTVTDPSVTRFFMTVEEAVQLVIQAGAVGRDGEALVLDMGEPVRIDDVARQLIAESGRPIDIVYTGLRHGEKLHEVLFGLGEQDRRPFHPGISHVEVPALSIEQMPGRDHTDDLVAELVRCCGLPGRADDLHSLAG